MKHNLHRVPILSNRDVACPVAGLTSRIDGFKTVGELLEGVPAEQWSEAIDFLGQATTAGHLLWRDEWSPLRWCRACDVPLLQDTCGLCGEPAGPLIELKFPCNPRPLIPHDEFLFRAAGLAWPPGRVVVVNSWSRPDETGWELVCGGQVAGDLLHLAQEDTYVFRPASPTAPELTRPSAKPAPTLATLVRANQARLKALEDEAVRFIRAWCRPGPHNLRVVTFSGGKDSVVLAHLCHLSGRKLRLVQIDTGIDPADNHEYSDRLLGRFPNLKPTRFRNGDLFWRALEKLGPPANDFQWCRVVLKNSSPFRSPTFRWTQRLRGVKPFLPVRAVLVDGPRRREEPWRIALKRTLRIPEAPVETTTIRPILDFTDLDIWMYIERHGLEPNPTYHRDKHQRLVCLFCPDKDRHELCTSRELEPKAWERFEGELERWRARLGFPPEWTTQHLWRSEQPVSAYTQALGITGRVEQVAHLLQQVVRWDSPQRDGPLVRCTGTIQPPFDAGLLADWLRAVGKVRRSRNGLELTTSAGQVRIDRAGTIEIAGPEEAAVTEFTDWLGDWIVSWLNCIGCGICRSVFPQIRLREGRAFMGRLCRPSRRRVQQAIALCPVNAKGIRRCLTLRQDA